MIYLSVSQASEPVGGPESKANTLAADPGGITASLLGGGAGNPGNPDNTPTATNPVVSSTGPGGLVASLLGDPALNPYLSGSSFMNTPTGKTTDSTSSTDPPIDPNDLNKPSSPLSSPAATTIVVASHTFLVTYVSDIDPIVNGVTLSVSSSEMIDGQTIHNSYGSEVAIGLTTLSAPDPASLNYIGGIVTVTAVGQTFTASERIDPDNTGNRVILGSVTLPSTEATTVNEVAITAGDGGLIVDGTTTLPFVGQIVASTASSDPTGGLVTFKVAGQTLTASERMHVESTGSEIILGGVTLSSGQATSFHGAVVSACSDGLIVDGTTTVPFAQQTNASPAMTTVESDGVTLTALLGSGSQVTALLVGSTTFSRGLTTINGTQLSLGGSGITLVGSSTLSQAVTSSQQSTSATNETADPTVVHKTTSSVPTRSKESAATSLSPTRVPFLLL
jgi:hypothetical protein